MECCEGLGSSHFLGGGGGGRFLKVSAMAEKAHFLDYARCNSLADRTRSIPFLADQMEQADVIGERKSLSPMP